MQHIQKDQAIQRKNNEVCWVTNYPIDDQTLDFVVVKLAGRYPDSSRVVNVGCKEIVYVHEGIGQITVEGKEYLLNAGDVVLIEAGEKYYWEGNMQLFVSCRPAWTQEQHHPVE